MTVPEFLATLDQSTLADSQVLLGMMQKISGHEPKLWNEGTLGFDTYSYKYDSGREGSGLVIGFHPGKSKTTMYVMDGTHRYAELLTKLGNHTTTGYCLYIKKLSDVDLKILEQILRKSYENIKSQDGNITEILWKKV